jgi:hypothetical protein
MTIWLNVYPPVEEGAFPIFRRFWTKKEALENQYPGCLKTIEITF